MRTVRASPLAERLFRVSGTIPPTGRDVSRRWAIGNAGRDSKIYAARSSKYVKWLTSIYLGHESLTKDIAYPRSPAITRSCVISLLSKPYATEIPGCPGLACCRFGKSTMETGSVWRAGDSGPEPLHSA
jgi:hypothetical protein